MPIKLICVAGARPNFMKVAPLIRALGGDPFFQVLLVHTGQHYDERMSGQFFEDLEIPEPDYHLEVGSGSHAVQTAEILRRFEPVVEKEAPRGVIVVGDVNSTLGCALVAAKLQIPVVHVEAGLRSFDRGMPEEINRLATDAITDVFLVTESSGAHNLRAEGVDEAKVHVVGNLMIDTLRFNLEKARHTALAIEPPPRAGGYGVVTLHRPANVDDPATLDGIVSALSEIGRELPLYFPVHPRTRARLDSAEWPADSRIQLLDPMGYLEFLHLMSDAAAVFTDSGGIQEETTALGIPCMTLRENTERPVTIDEGTNTLAGTTRESILAAWAGHRRKPKQGRVPALWDGHAAERCRAVLGAYFGARQGG